MVVVSDTTCITTLLKAGEVELLQKLFGEILIPNAVHRELSAFHAQLPSFIRVSEFPVARRLAGTERLGAGEAETLALAKELQADLLLTDDRKARVAAQRLGLDCLGLVGLVLNGKQKGLFPSVTNMLERLQNAGGLYLSDSVKERARMLAGE